MSRAAVHALTTAERQRFLAEGYLVVPEVVPAAMCERVIAAMCAFVGVDARDPASFADRGVRGHGLVPQGHGIIPLHHHQALWDVRQWPPLHAIFAFLYGTERLWVSQDRVSFKAPADVHPDGFRMEAVHWDGDPRTLVASTRANPGSAIGGRALSMQGLVYLTDTPAEKGAFAMVPSLYRGLEVWLSEPRTEAELRRPDVAGHPLVPVPGTQGTLVVWNRLMPHTSLANETTEPRLVQYVMMTPARDDASAERAALVKGCMEKRPPAWAIRQRVPGQLDPEPGPPVALTALGRKLAGIDDWS